MSQTTNAAITKKVTLTGYRDAMFDRYAGDNDTQLATADKLYLNADSKIVLPALNIVSMLSAQNSPSAAQRFLPVKTYKKTAAAILSYVDISPFEIPFLRDGKPIVFSGFGPDEVCPSSGVYIRRDVARLKKNGVVIPNPKVRPVLPAPWELKFDLTFYPNDEVKLDTIEMLLLKAGPAIGIGTFRGVFGKFQFSWE